MSDSNTIISDLTLVVNNIAFAIVPNSMKADLGLGEQEVVAATAGGGRTTAVYSFDAKSMISHYKMELYCTQLSVDVIRTWKSLANTLAIKLINNNNGKTLTINNAAITNLVEFEFAASGKVSIEFKGDRTV